MEKEEKSRRACAIKWYEWKKSGRGPRTREAAIRIIAEFKNAPIEEVRSSLAKGKLDTDGALQVDDSLSFAVWDIQENGALALDYDVWGSWLQGLLIQAGNFIRSYTRNSMKIGSRTVSYPAYLSTRSGVQSLADLKESNQLDVEIERMIRRGLDQVYRWRAMYGRAVRNQVLTAIAKLNEEAVRAFEELESVPSKKKAA